MAIIRELVNLISFKVDKGSVSGAASTFKSLAKAAAAVGLAAVAAGSKLTVDFEDARSKARFFAIELETINKIVKDNEGGIFSRLEITKAIGELSDLNINAGKLEESFSLLSNISIVRPTEGLKGISSFFKDFSLTGSIEALKQLGGVTKEQAELMSQADFGKALGGLTQTERVSFAINLMKKDAERIAKLIKEQEETLSFSVKGVTAAASNITGKFGATIKPAMKEILDLAKAIIERVENFKPLWDGIEKGVNSVVAIIKEFTGETTNTFDFFGGMTADFNKGIEGLKAGWDEFLKWIATTEIGKAFNKLTNVFNVTQEDLDRWNLTNKKELTASEAKTMPSLAGGINSFKKGKELPTDTNYLGLNTGTQGANLSPAPKVTESAILHSSGGFSQPEQTVKTIKIQADIKVNSGDSKMDKAIKEGVVKEIASIFAKIGGDFEVV